MSSKELKRDYYYLLKIIQHLFINLANDENVQLRNFAIRAQEASIIKLSARSKNIYLGIKLVEN